MIIANALKLKLLFLGAMLLLISCTVSAGPSTKPVLLTCDPENVNKIQLSARYQYPKDIASAIVFVRDIQRAKKVFSSFAVKNKAHRNWELERYLDDRVNLETQTAIEARLQNIKRLNIIRSFSKQRAILIDEREAVEIGAPVNYVESTKLVDHIIALELTHSRDEQKLSERQDMALYRAEISYQVIHLVNNSARVVESGVVEGKSKRHKVYDIVWNRKTRKYEKKRRQGEENFDVKQAYLQATCRATLSLVSELSHAFPVVGRIRQQSKDIVELDIGLDQGVVPDQVFTIFAELDGRYGPLAAGKTVHLQLQSSELKIFKWSESPFARKLIDRIRTGDPGLNTNQQYAASMGLPYSYFSDEECLREIPE